MNKHKKKDNLIWIDLEMTGLDVKHDRIIEIATVVTDAQLNVVAEGPVIAIHQSDKLLAGMDDWNTSHHTKSGLVKRVQESKIRAAQAEKQTLDFLKEHVLPNRSPMCGNSVWQDRRFLDRWMPTLAEFFHYRNLDVSTLKELAKRWAPKVAHGIKKHSKHLALSDIYDSINELKYYRDHLFNLPT